MSSTVLAHLTLKLTSQRENAATEALAFLLNRSAAARAALARQLSPGTGDVPKINRVATQPRVGDESRPDLVLLDEAGLTLGFVEAKFWAALTDAQPVSYLERLRENGGGMLVILAPQRRLPLLAAEIKERCQRAQLAIGAWGARGGLVGPTRVALLSWRTLLDALEQALVEDREALSDLRQIRGLCERFESEGFIPLTREDLENIEIPRMVKSLAELANEIVESGIRDGLIDVKGLRPTHYWTAAGRYSRLRCGTVTWIGVAYDRWNQFGRTPMWVHISPSDPTIASAARQALQSWIHGEPARAYLDEHENVLIPLDLVPGAEKETVVARALEQLAELDVALSAAAMPISPDVATG